MASETLRKSEPPRLTSQPALLWAASIFLIALALYGWTMAPTVTLVDSGELIVVARYLGVAHPPGFPLWTMLAHLASLVPLGSVALRINFVSAFFAALAAGMLTLVTAEFLTLSSYLLQPKARSAKKHSGRKRGPVSAQGVPEEGSRVSSLAVLVPAVGSGLLIAFSRTLWSYATVAEVYTLNTLLILAIVFLLLRWRRGKIITRKFIGEVANTGVPATTSNDVGLYAAAFLFGLALGVHHVTVALTLPALAIIVYRTEGLKFFLSRRLVYAALISIAGLIAVYAYLPIAASRSPLINWGDPHSFEEIWWHVTGRQYQVFVSFSPEIMGRQFLEFGRMVLREFGPAWCPLTLLLALAGFVAVFKRDRIAFWFLVVLIGADLLYALSYEIAEDKDAYYLPAFVSIAIAAGFGLLWLIESVISRHLNVRSARPVAAAALLVASLIALAGNWPFNNRRNYLIAHDYVENICSAIESDGLLLTLDWQVASPMLYVQEIEQRWRDVKVVDVNLLRRSWYFDYLRRAHPRLIERSHFQIDAFVSELRQWEQDPQIYARDPALTRRISAAFDEMIRTIITNESRVGPVYVTSDLVLADHREGDLKRWLEQNFQLVPQGLVFNLANGPGFHDSPDLQLETRGLADGSLRFEKDDVVSLKVFPVYVSMLINRGRYLASFKQRERAAAAFSQARALDSRLSAEGEVLPASKSELDNP